MMVKKVCGGPTDPKKSADNIKKSNENWLKRDYKKVAAKRSTQALKENDHSVDALRYALATHRVAKNYDDDNFGRTLGSNTQKIHTVSTFGNANRYDPTRRVY